MHLARIIDFALAWLQYLCKHEAILVRVEKMDPPFVDAYRFKHDSNALWLACY